MMPIAVMTRNLCGSRCKQSLLILRITRLVNNRSQRCLGSLTHETLRMNPGRDDDDSSSSPPSLRRARQFSTATASRGVPPRLNNLQHRSFGSKKSAKIKAAIASSNPQPAASSSFTTTRSDSNPSYETPDNGSDDSTSTFSPFSSSKPTLGATSPPSLIVPSLVRTDLSDQVTWGRQHIGYTGADFQPPLTADPLSLQPDTAASNWESELIDFKDLYDPELHMRTVPKSWKGYEMSTPLFEDLLKTIVIKGKALTVANFMQQVLTHPEHGYYSNHQRQDDISWDDNGEDDDDDWDKDPTQQRQRSSMIGPKGDFVTAPEISQIFGESIAVWFITQWKAVLYRSLRLRLIELGPGKGTLMNDILRAANILEKGFFKSIREIHLVEQSPSLRQMQKEMLQTIDFVQWDFCEPTSTTPTSSTSAETNTSSNSKSSTSTPAPAISDQINITVKWHNYFSQVVQDVKQSDASNPKMCNLIVAQEFMDALPVHVFVKTPEGWRERLVDLAAFAEDVEEELEEDVFGTSRTASPVVPNPSLTTPSSSSPLKPRLRFVTAPNVTPALTTLLNVHPDTGKSLDSAFDAAPEGQVLEVCPEGILLVQDMAQLIEEHGGGCALLVDYGQVGSSDSLRGYSQHQQVDPLSRPGLVDVTADVDFGALRHAVNNRRRKSSASEVSKPSASESSAETKTDEAGELSLEEEFADFFYEDEKPEEKKDKVESQEEMSESNTQAATTSSHSSISAFGPITQGKFLASMGAVDRIARFIENENTSDEDANLAYQALEKLVSAEQMGERFKVLAISAKKDGIFEPAGFDGLDG